MKIDCLDGLVSGRKPDQGLPGDRSDSHQQDCDDQVPKQLPAIRAFRLITEWQLSAVDVVAAQPLRTYFVGVAPHAG
jgi:hypothetical protein